MSDDEILLMKIRVLGEVLSTNPTTRERVGEVENYTWTISEQAYLAVNQKMVDLVAKL